MHFHAGINGSELPCEFPANCTSFQIVKRSMSTALFDVTAFLMSKSFLTISTVLINSSDYFF